MFRAREVVKEIESRDKSPPGVGLLVNAARGSNGALKDGRGARPAVVTAVELGSFPELVVVAIGGVPRAGSSSMRVWSLRAPPSRLLHKEKLSDRAGLVLSATTFDEGVASFLCSESATTVSVSIVSQELAAAIGGNCFTWASGSRVDVASTSSCRR